MKKLIMKYFNLKIYTYIYKYSIVFDLMYMYLMYVKSDKDFVLKYYSHRLIGFKICLSLSVTLGCFTIIRSALHHHE